MLPTMLPTTTSELLADPAVNLARQALYRFTALALLDPRRGSWHQLQLIRQSQLLSSAAAFIRQYLNTAGPPPDTDGWVPDELDPQNVLGRLPNSSEAHNQAYEQVFGLVVAKACPPYETEYIDSKFAFQRSNTLADINGFYNAFGLRTAADRPERPDHIVQELEFMAVLISLQVQAQRAAPQGQRAQVCYRAQERFLREHLAWWAPAFARLLVRESEHPFFAAAGSFLASLMRAEQALLDVEVARGSARTAPAACPMERPEDCEGCQLGSW